MQWDTPLGVLKHYPEQDVLIKSLVRGRWCWACPVSHFNTGNIITTQTCKPQGKKQCWPGWRCRVVEGISTLDASQDVHENPSIVIYNEAMVYKPPIDLAYNHVHVQVTQRALDVDASWPMLFRLMQHDMKHLELNAFHFWCTANTKDKTIYIFVHEIIPHNARLYLDVNLLNRRDTNAFLITPENLPVSPYPVVQTSMGSMRVLDTDNRDFVEVAEELAEQLWCNSNVTEKT